MELWHLIFVMYMIATTGGSLINRQFAKTSRLNPYVSGLARNIIVGLPINIGLVVYAGGFMPPSLGLLPFVLLDATAALLNNYFNFYARRHLDTAVMDTFTRMYLLPVVLFGSLFLGEGLNKIQLTGAGLVLLSTLIIGRLKIPLRDLWLVAVSTILLSIIVLASRQVVVEAGLPLALAWGFMIASTFRVIFFGKQLIKDIPLVKQELKLIVGASVMGNIQNMLFQLSAVLTSNVSLVSSLAATKAVFTAIAAAIILGERGNLKKKLLAASVSVVGVLLLK